MIYYISPDNPKVLNNAIAHLGNLSPQKSFAVEIKERKNLPKTTAQRNYFHALLDLFESETGNDAEDVKMRLKYTLLPLRAVKIKGAVHLHPISTEKITREQYGNLIKAVQMLCMDHGIAYPDPQDCGLQF